MIVNNHLVLPTSVFTQNLPAPSQDEIVIALKEHNLCLLDADKIAEEAGSILSQNVVMLGAASLSIPLKSESLIDAVKHLVPKKTVDINVKAFELGRVYGGKC